MLVIHGQACAPISDGVHVNTISLAATVKISVSKRVKMRSFQNNLEYLGFQRFGLHWLRCMKLILVFLFFLFHFKSLHLLQLVRTTKLHFHQPRVRREWQIFHLWLNLSIKETVLFSVRRSLPRSFVGAELESGKHLLNINAAKSGKQQVKNKPKKSPTNTSKDH